MKTVFKFLACLTGVSVLASCSEENIPAVSETTSGDFYTAVAINFANGTRSGTDNPKDDYSTSKDGTELGHDTENKVNSVAVVLATTDDQPTVIAWKHVSPSISEKAENGEGDNAGNGTDDKEDNNPVYVAAFQAAELEEAAGKKFQPIVFCNPTNKLLELLDQPKDNGKVNLAKLQYSLKDEKDEYAWTKNAFLMSNAKSYTGEEYTIPAKTDFKKFNTPEKAFPLGVVDVERAAVRFDLKENHTFKENANEYNVENDKDAIAHLKLVKVGLFNMSKSFYYLRRVSTEVTGANSQIGKPELPWMQSAAATQGNYVVDTDWEFKTDYKFDKENKTATNYFWHSYENIKSNNLLAEGSGIIWSDVSEIFGGREDDKDWNNGDKDYDGYYFWRYATENTIPGVDQQKIGITTGIFFCTQIIANDAEGDLAKDMQEKKKLYVFEDKLYGAWDKILAAAAANPGSTLSSAVESANALIPEGDGKTIEDVKPEDLANLGFKAYSADNDGNYYVYYAYKNRHNDNGDYGLMGEMEFATVRNNVYKLSLTSIKMWGHPTDPKDPDPDPEDPDDPDESEKVYFKVQARVLPWVVRINNVSF